MCTKRQDSVQLCLQGEGHVSCQGTLGLKLYISCLVIPRRSGRNLHAAWPVSIYSCSSLLPRLPFVNPLFQSHLPASLRSLWVPTSILLLVTPIPSRLPSQCIIFSLQTLPFCSRYPTLTLRGRCEPHFTSAQPTLGPTAGVCPGSRSLASGSDVLSALAAWASLETCLKHWRCSVNIFFSR